MNADEVISGTSTDRAGARGRPRDPARAQAIREAVLDLVAERGYDRVTIEAVAARAGAGRATIYRRWTSKAELVVDALAGLHPVGDAPDTGSLRGDLEGICSGLGQAREARALAVMRGLASALPHDGDLWTALNERLGAPRRAAMARILTRAIDRGEIARDRNVELLSAVIPALMIHRLLTGEGVPSPGFARTVVEQILLPAATAQSPTSRLGCGEEPA